MSESNFGNDERRLLDESVRGFFAGNYPFERFRAIQADDTGPGFDRDAWRHYAELGWLGVALPETLGGAGGGMTELAIIAAGAGRHLAQEPLLASAVLGTAAVHRLGRADQHGCLAPVQAGDQVLALAHHEPDGGYARDHVATVAARRGDGYTLDGAKQFTLHADAADTLLVSARVGGADGPPGLFMVDAGARGLTRRAAPSLDGRRGAMVVLDGVAVDAGALLGEAGAHTAAAIDAVLDRGVLAACAEAAGAMAAVTEQTIDYLRQRQQFGRALAGFQVLQHRLVDMSLACEESRAVVQAAAQALDEDAPYAQRRVWQARVQTATAAKFVGAQGVQLHGGMGMTDELAVGHYYKRLMVLAALFGDADWYRARLGEDVAAGGPGA